MIKLEHGMCINDVEQWVGGGFFLTEVNGRTVPAEVSWWPERDDEGECYDEELYCLTTVEDEPTHVRFHHEAVRDHILPHWPLCGSVNLLYNKLAIHVERQQMKQWRRTFNWRQVKVLVPQQWFLLGNGHENFATHRSVPDIFNPQYPADYEEWFADGWRSVALSPHVIVVNTTPRMVYYNGQLACKLRRDGQFDPVDLRITHLLSKLYPEGLR